MLLYTGGRLAPRSTPTLDAREAARYADLLLGAPRRCPLPRAPPTTDAAAGDGRSSDAFAGFAAPFGGGAAPPA